MKITIRQLKQLIKEQVEESAATAMYGAAQRKREAERKRMSVVDKHTQEQKWDDEEDKVALGVEHDKRINIKGVHVIENATVDEAAGKVSGRASIMGSATITDDAKIQDEAMVGGHAHVGGFAVVCDSAMVGGYAMIHGKAVVGGQCKVSGQAVIHGNAQITGKALIRGDADICGDAIIVSGLWDGKEGKIDSGTWASPGIPASGQRLTGPYRE